MRFIRLETHCERYTESEPFLFCKACGKTADSHWHFCPWCGHKYVEENTPTIIKAEGELTHIEKLRYIAEHLND